MRADYIVVGQGIAGSNLAYALVSRGKKVVVFDPSWRDAACLVAAGVINPITGQRLVKSWRSALAHPFAKKFYASLESVLHAKFFHDRKILQLCKSPEEHALWSRRKADAEYAEFIGEGASESVFESLNDKFGHHFIERSAWVEPSAIMPAFARFFNSLGILRNESFDYSRLRLLPDGGVEYGDISARAVVFCEGWQAVKNPYFNWLPYRCAKGEILQLQSDAAADIPEHIIHRGNWIMKCAEDQFRIGSTWDREHLDTAPTADARAELLGAVGNILRNAGELRVVNHSAGVRPCTATTRPHLGKHPKFGALYSFNGFGSKGYALSPYFAEEFAEYLEGGKPLDSEADISRHVRRFFYSA